MNLENLRSYVRIGILVFFAGLISFVVIFHTGTQPGQIKADIIWSFATGVMVSKLIEFYMQDTIKLIEKNIEKL
jgi:hypothetical protein